MSVWRDIIGFEGHYQVSDQGEVKSLNYLRTGKPKIMKPGFDGSYYYVFLSKSGTVKKFHIHTLVTIMFPEICGERFDGCEVDHINACKTDNRATNLKVTTRSGNHLNPILRTHMSIVMKNRPDYINKKIAAAKAKPVNQYTIDGVFVKHWDSAKQIQRETVYSQAAISRCCNGKYHQAYGYVWKYATSLNDSD